MEEEFAHLEIVEGSVDCSFILDEFQKVLFSNLGTQLSQDDGLVGWNLISKVLKK